MPPILSFVVLTWNEEANIAACLASIAAQDLHGLEGSLTSGVGQGLVKGLVGPTPNQSTTAAGTDTQDVVADGAFANETVEFVRATHPIEVIVVDAGSTDATVARISAARNGFPFDLRLHIGPERMPIGEARNLGVAMATAPAVAFLSADAELSQGWARQALASLETSAMAFGLQVHAPHQWTLGAAVRGLRYTFPQSATKDPLRFASNVAAAYHKPVLQRFPFDPWANAAEDLLLASRAAHAGYRAHYNPALQVRHHDVSSLRQELRKNLREGRGCGLYVAELGVQWWVIAWLALLTGATGLMLLDLPAGLVALLGIVWLPALRRGWRRRKHMPRRFLLAGIAASPAFDLAFLVQYVRGLVGAHGLRAASPKRGA